MNRVLHTLNALLAVTLVAASVAAFPELPDRVPAHLGADGEPTRWTDRSFWSWFLLPMIALATVGLSYVCAALVTRRPNLVNLPDKRRLLELPSEYQAPILALVRQMLYALSVHVLLMFSVVQLSMWEAALGNDVTGYTVLILVMAMLTTPIVLIGWLPRIQAALTHAERELAARRS